LVDTGYPLSLAPPDISPYRTGNTGIDYVTTFESGVAGPHLVINALSHGNEICGAVAISFLFALGVRPRVGKLTLSLANVAAYQTFDPARPTASRFLDEDFNRLWSAERLEGPGESVELRRARELRRIFDAADVLLDLHSMQHATAPLLLCGRSARGLALARAIGFPEWIVRDSGHEAGRRLLDYDGFADPAGHKTALLVECGQHWQADSGTVAKETALRFLLRHGAIDPAVTAPFLPEQPPRRQRLVDVTEAVTLAGDSFAFTQEFIGMEVIPTRGTLIARDGDRQIRTPYDHCVLIMPSRRLTKGQTAVRLGRIVE
jgi:predicted deacylase